MCTSAHSCACTRAVILHTYPDTYEYKIYQCHSNTPPRIVHPTDSVARVRKKDDMPKTGYSINTDADIKYADAHERARPPKHNYVGTDVNQNCVGSDARVDIKIETPPVRVPFAHRSAFTLDIPVYRSLLLSTLVNLA